MNGRSSTVSNDNDVLAQYKAIATAARKRLAKNHRVRRNLPGGGRLRIDRQLPFLCLYRGIENDGDVGTRELITSEASYLFARSDGPHHDGVSLMCGEIADAMQEYFGTFLMIEVWAGERSDQPCKRAGFSIVCDDVDSIPTTIEALRTALESIKFGNQPASVSVAATSVAEVRGLPVVDVSCSRMGACCQLGLMVEPVYRDPRSGGLYPVVLQRLRRPLAGAIRQTVAEFTGSGQSTPTSAHYDSFGPSSLVKAARLVDQQLCEVSESFDFLLQVTPTNADDAWQAFQESDYQALPPLLYRHLPYHPNLLKRRLFAIEIERIEDPTLAHLLWEKQDEIDRQLTALRDLHDPETSTRAKSGRSKFLASSLQLYGRPESSLVDLAREILERVKIDSDTDGNPPENCVGAEGLIEAARHEIDHYHSRANEFTAVVQETDSIASGIMVSHDRLLISSSIKVLSQRVTPLLHHEVGTHLLTYFNGRCQPFRQLYAGLAGCEELQEGLAVLAEYLVGGLSAKRIRTLAARVVAVARMVAGESFASVFRRLHEQYGFSKRQSFTTALRVFRGGGLTKDAIYLRGLRDLLGYLGQGHDIEPLYVGKISLSQVPYVQELRRRTIIQPSRLLPRFLDAPDVRDRLEACRGMTVMDLIETETTDKGSRIAI